MAVVNEVDFAKLNGDFYEKYAKQIVDIRSAFAILQNDLSWVSQDEMIGNNYNQPVILTHSHGFTYAAPDAGAFAINTPVAFTMKNATVTGTSLLLEERVPLDVAARSARGDQAFKSVWGLVAKSMKVSFEKRQEMMYLWGGSLTTASGLGRLKSASFRISGGGTGTQVFELDPQHWAAAIWQGMEGAQLDGYASGSVPGVKRNSNALITLSTVDFTNRRLTLVGNSADLDALAASDYLFFLGSKGNEFVGLDAVAANTGTLFGVDGSAFSLWQGNSYDCQAGPLTMQKILTGMEGPASRGAVVSGSYKLIVHPNTWQDVANNLAATRRYDASYTKAKAENGFQSVTFYSQVGGIEIVSHPLMKAGFALGYETTCLKRVGATDLTFNVPGRGDEMIRLLQSNAGVGIWGYSLQGLFCTNPASCVRFTNITNNS